MDRRGNCWLIGVRTFRLVCVGFHRHSGSGILSLMSATVSRVSALLDIGAHRLSHHGICLFPSPRAPGAPHRWFGARRCHVYVCAVCMICVSDDDACIHTPVDEVVNPFLVMKLRLCVEGG